MLCWSCGGAAGLADVLVWAEVLSVSAAGT